MAVTLFMVRATITKDKDGAFNRWYNEEHVPQVLQFNGAVSARRYKKILGEDKFEYMALYEFASEEVFRRFLELGPPQNPDQGLRCQFWRGLGPATCRLPADLSLVAETTRAARPKRKAGHRCGWVPCLQSQEKVLRDTRVAPTRGAFLASLYDVKKTLSLRPGSIGICNLSTATGTEHHCQRPRRTSPGHAGKPQVAAGAGKSPISRGKGGAMQRPRVVSTPTAGY